MLGRGARIPQKGKKREEGGERERVPRVENLHRRKAVFRAFIVQTAHLAVCKADFGQSRVLKFSFACELVGKLVSLATSVLHGQGIIPIKFRRRFFRNATDARP